MNSSGNVGFGIAPNSSYKLTINGFVKFDNGSYYGILIDNSSYLGKAIYPTGNNYCQVGLSNRAFRAVYAYSVYQLSDKRQKENIRDINNALDIVLGLKGVKYDIKKEYTYSDELPDKAKEKLDKKRKNHVGFLAQDVESILPEVVDYDDSTDVYSINYSRIIPILVEAIREQQQMIDALSKNNGNKNKSAEIEGEIQESTLFQNAPNPFSKSTQIGFTIAETVQSAMLNIYNMNGSQLKSIAIAQTGNGAVTINGSEFGAGIYIYML